MKSFIMLNEMDSLVFWFLLTMLVLIAMFLIGTFLPFYAAKYSVPFYLYCGAFIMGAKSVAKIIISERL